MNICDLVDDISAKLLINILSCMFEQMQYYFFNLVQVE